VLANTIHFKGRCSVKFDPAYTQTEPFTRSDGTQVSAQMMHLAGNAAGSYDYFQGTLQGTAFQAARVPYGAGRLSMLIVLPDAQAPLASFVSGISAATLTGWNAAQPRW
jgi:serine protease inhibitor